MSRSVALRPQGGRDLTQGPVAAALLLFALPALASNVLQSINGSINAIWVGQLLGATGLAATANANLIMFMLFTLVFGFGMAATIIIGQCVGRGDMAGVRRAVGTGLTLFLIMGIATAVLGWLHAPELLQLLGTPAEIYPQALVYLRVMLLGLPTALLTVFLSMALRGTGDSLTPLLLGLPGMGVDIALNPLLIAGWGPVPAFGIMGAGMATLAANLVSLLLLVGFIYARDLPVRLRGREFAYLMPRRDIIKTMLHKGFPMALQMMVMSGSAIGLMWLVNREGLDTIAAYGAVNQLWTYIQMPAVAVGMAVSAMAAQNIGAGHWHRVDAIARAGIAINLALTGAVVLATVLFDVNILALFLPGSGESIAIAAHVNLIASWSFMVMGVTMILSSITRANGATFVPLVIMVVAYVPGRLGAVFALEPLLQVEALWWSF
ncbi:MAG: MATE family efflux transporter, partial [Polymorphobacter sp.]